MSRCCVVCGKRTLGKVQHYPRNKNEALIWQRSMGAFDLSVDTIQSHCCVCIKHIPKFLKLVKQHAAKRMAQDKLRRPSLNVLVLPGAKRSLFKQIENQKHIEEQLDADIIVQESCIIDPGITFPDIGETEAAQDGNRDTEQCGNIGNQPDSTDVLLLGRSQNYPGKCEQCVQNGASQSKSDDPQIPWEQCNERDQLREIIKQQQHRIYQLESQVSRQGEWHSAIQHKMSELYADFEIGNADQTGCFDDNSNAEMPNAPAGTRFHWCAERIPELNISVPDKATDL